MSASTSLKRHVAVISGSEARISGAIALLFAAAGAAIVIACVIAERYKKVRQRIADIDGSSLFCRVNLMDSEAIGITIGAVDTHFGRIDIPVNNAGGVTPRGFLKQSERSWRRHINLNINSMLAATSAAVPIMIGGKQGGEIVNITSIRGSRAAPNFAVHAACKAGMIGFAKTMALELSAEGIPVKAIGKTGRRSNNSITSSRPFWAERCGLRMRRGCSVSCLSNVCVHQRDRSSR